MAWEESTINTPSYQTQFTLLIQRPRTILGHTVDVVLRLLLGVLLRRSWERTREVRSLSERRASSSSISKYPAFGHFSKMNLLTISKSKATVVVGVDFGTTYSGFAYARTSEPDEVNKFYEWPDLTAGGGALYCKTPTSLLYETGQSPGSYVLKDWAYSALVKSARGRKSNRPEQISYGEHSVGTNRGSPVPVNIDAGWRLGTDLLISLFKLQLVSGEARRASIPELPEGLTPRRLISDYLRMLSELIMEALRKALGNHITMDDVQWCLTVPAIWDDWAKQEMKICASMAGMTNGPECPTDLINSASPHPIIIVLEPEAASLYCQRKVQFPLKGGDQFLVVDVGGGTVDLVLHEKIGSGSGLKVREVSPSSGGLCGGSFVDKAFFDFLSCKISCFDEFSRTNTDSVLKLKGWWETIKYGFDDNMHFPYDLELPARLASAWEADERANNGFFEGCGSYDVIELSLEDILSFFDPVVNEILELIQFKMVEASNLKAIMVVGGFSGSPYLVKRIKQEFSARVGTLVVLDEPGSAICCGAVSYGIYGADVIMSRFSKKTYGIQSSRQFFSTDPRHLMFRDDDGESLCERIFSAFTRRNEEIPLDHCERQTFCPVFRSQKEMAICLYSTLDSNPKYVCDAGVTKEGVFLVTFPSENELGEKPRVCVSMYFGRTLIVVEAEGLNFGTGEKFKMQPVRFEKTFDDGLGDIGNPESVS